MNVIVFILILLNICNIKLLFKYASLYEELIVQFKIQYKEMNKYKSLNNNLSRQVEYKDAVIKNFTGRR